jgi:hypothetical protein
MLGVASLASVGGCTFTCGLGTAATGGVTTGFDCVGTDSALVWGAVVAEPTSLEGCTAGVLLALTGVDVAEGEVIEGAEAPVTGSTAGGFAAATDTGTDGHRCP